MNQITKITGLFLLLVLFSGMVNASILANTSADKKYLGENEIAILTVKILNDSETEIQGVQLRLQADEGIKFLEGEEKTFTYKQIEKMKPREAVELKLKIKCTVSKEQRINIYTYYGIGESTENASVSFIESKPLPIEVTTSSVSKEENGKNKTTINYKMINHYGKNIYKTGAEIITPAEFEIETEPVFMEVVGDEGTIEETFTVNAPIETEGDYQLILAYGYIDSNTPHYFEKNFTVKYSKPNYELIGLIGLVVLIIAAYLFLKKDAKNDIKGSSEKK
jgi:hypothetical protein